MSTWHQDKNPQPLWHAVKWTVVEDGPGRMTSVSRWHTQDEVEQHATRVKGYVLAPAPKAQP